MHKTYTKNTFVRRYSEKFLKRLSYEIMVEIRAVGVPVSALRDMNPVLNNGGCAQRTMQENPSIVQYIAVHPYLSHLEVSTYEKVY
jgi:hypothetical protein